MRYSIGVLLDDSYSTAMSRALEVHQMAKSTVDPASFQAQVLEEIKTLELLVSSKEAFEPPRDKLSSSGGQSFDRWISIGLLNVATKLNASSLQRLRRDKKIDEYTEQGRAFLQQSETRRFLCPTLRGVGENLSKLKSRSIEKDASEIAAAITPLFLQETQAPALSLAPEPMLFALCAWMIAQTGVANYCAVD